jgi:hypothetical protein
VAETTSGEGADHLFIIVELKERRMKALIDSGAQGNFISPRIVNELRLDWNQKDEPYSLNTVEGTSVSYGNGTVDREATLVMRTARQEEQITLDITDTSQHDVILGIPWLRKHNPQIDWITGQLQWGVLTPAQDHIRGKRKAQNKRSRLGSVKHFTTSSLGKITRWIALLRTSKPILSDSIPEEYRKYSELFQEAPAGKLPEHSQWDHEIPLEEGKHPQFKKIYALNQEQRRALKEYVQENLRKGFIRPSTSPAGYPILFVPKKNGKLRLCVDYRQLNDITIKNRHPLPLITELRDRLQGAQWFTTLDLRGAYNLIRIKAGEEWKTAFRSQEGHYEYMVMPFGLTNAPATFQGMIQSVLREYLDISAVVYLDDILIYSRTLDEHREHVDQVLRRLQEHQLLVEPEKSKFHAQEVDYLGHTIRPGEVSMQAEKIEAVRDWPTPQNVKDVRSFLGFANYYRRFIQGYAKIAAPMSDLTKNDTKFKWDNKTQEAFDNLRKSITEGPVLRIPDPERPFEVETDASDYALGGQLGQRDDEGRLHPIAFFSKKLSGPELNYQIHDKELMAIIMAFQEWKPYLCGANHKVKVYTDHKNLTQFTTTKELNKRQTRWAEFLSEFDFQIIYMKGSENGRADALSRRTDHETEVPVTATTLLRTAEDGSLEMAERQINALFRLQPDDKWKNLPQDPETGRTQVPEDKKEELVQEFHAAPANGHKGVFKTWKKISAIYDITRREVAKTLAKCDTCQKNKATRHKPYGELRVLPIPQRAWGSIAFDHITKLPLSREPMSGAKYDSIFVVTDRLTKYGYFIPYKESSSAEELAYVFLRIIASNHGLPDEIVTDRGATFRSKFWQALMAQLGVNHKLSTAYHPQTDGQTERLNQTLENYVRSYVNYQQDDWVQLLPMAQFAYNSSEAEGTKQSPFYANYGFEPEIHRQPRDHEQVPRAMTTADKLKGLHDSLKDEIRFAQERMSRYYNPKRLKGPTFERGDKVYLTRRNIKTKRPSDKLDHKRLGPFEVTDKIGDTNYRLSLPQGMRIHPVFHISLLEPAHRNTKIQDDIEVETEESEYEVERILDSRLSQQGTLEYLIKWEGYEHSENTWEPREHLSHCQQTLRQYHRQNPDLPKQQNQNPATRMGTTSPRGRRYPTRQ